MVERLSFEIGFYSRAWEISSAHLTQEASNYLMNLADLATLTAFLFIAFRIPSKGMPESLANTVYLAGLADVRVLVFDADAAVLDGLPLHDE